MKPERKIDDNLLLQKHAEGMTGQALAALFGCSGTAISKRLKRLIPQPLPPELEALTDKQAAFVQRVAAGESATNATWTTHDCTSRASAKELGQKLMNIPAIQDALEVVMDNHGLTRNYRVKKLKQHCESADPSVGLKALNLAFTLADEMPAVKSKNLNLNTEISPVDLSKYR